MCTWAVTAAGAYLRGNSAHREFGGQYHAAEIALWEAADLRYMTRGGEGVGMFGRQERQSADRP